LVRESIIYLALAIIVEERNRRNEQDPKKLIPKMEIDYFPDEFKN